jgi:sulfotransferase
MIDLHALAGLPRSGTTLLGNVLAQHPDVHVSGTSALPLCLEAVQGVLSTAPEVQSDLATVPGAYERYVAAMQGLIDGWYSQLDGDPAVIDKGRGWIMHRALLDQLAPGSVLVVCVRDPRDVVASIERQHRATAAFNSPLARTIYEVAELLMQPDGMVGGPMRFAEDLIRRKVGGVVWVRYESLVIDPATTVAKVADTLGLAPFAFDFTNVENVATDLDAIHRNKYPHDGSGPIKATGTDWRDVLEPGLAAAIIGRWPLYAATFGYS